MNRPSPRSHLWSSPDSTPKGEIKNPYDGNPQAIAEGHQLFLFANSCNGCHGGNGGGARPPLSNLVCNGTTTISLFRSHHLWLGSACRRTATPARTGSRWSAPCRPSAIIEDSDNLLKIIAFVRSLTAGQEAGT